MMQPERNECLSQFAAYAGHRHHAKIDSALHEIGPIQGPEIIIASLP